MNLTQLKRGHHIYTATLFLSVVISLSFGFTSHGSASRARVSFVQRSYQGGPEPSFDGFGDYRVNGTSDVPDDVPNDVGQNKVDETLNKEKTLYEILGADPAATRAELKQCYVKLAKATHPDALVASGVSDLNQPDFGDVAAAWRVLGDAKLRKRYDRDLKAKEFSENAQRFANENLEKAVPAVAEMMDKVAVPFLRRTTATTWAVGRAVAKGVSGFSQQSGSNNTSSFTDTLFDVVKAGQDAGRVVDGIELSEKSSELEKKAEEEQKRGIALEQQLINITEKRLFATLSSPKFALSSEEAKQVLDKLDSIGEGAHKTVMVAGLLRTNVGKEITHLEQVENEFTDKLVDYEAADREWNEMLLQNEVAKDELAKRKEHEIEARKALERAQKMVIEAKAHLVTSTNALKSVEQRVRRNAQEMDRITTSLSRRQERVRVALRQKADMTDRGLRSEYVTAEDLENMRQQEMRLAGETKQVMTMVSRLQSRAEKLKMRAEALEKWQQADTVTDMDLRNGLTP